MEGGKENLQFGSINTQVHFFIQHFIKIYKPKLIERNREGGDWDRERGGGRSNKLAKGNQQSKDFQQKLRRYKKTLTPSLLNFSYEIFRYMLIIWLYSFIYDDYWLWMRENGWKVEVT